MLNYLKYESLNTQKIKYYFALILNRVEPLDHRQKRYQRIAQSAATALAGKGIALIISFISVPLTVHYLGAERYGVWVTISTLLAWIQIADLGLGNGLTNAVSEAYSSNRPDLAQRYVATTFWLLCGAVTLLGGILFSVLQTVNWASIFNVQSVLAKSELSSAIAVAFLFALLSLPLSIIDKILGAYQEGARANYWTVGGNIVSLFGIIIVTRLQGNLVWLVVGYSGVLFIVKAISALWLFGKHMPWLRPTWSAVERHNIKQVSNVAGIFFTIQIAVLIITQTDNLIIAHYLGITHVTPYSITWRLFFYTTIPQMIIFSTLWPAYTEAFARKDGAWIRQTFRTNLIGSTFITALLVLPLILFGTVIIEKWAGLAAVPPYSLIVWMGIWSIISTAMSVIACILNACGHIKNQMIYGIMTAIVNICLSIMLVEPFGVTGVIASTVISYLLCNVIPGTIETRTIFSKLPIS